MSGPDIEEIDDFSELEDEDDEFFQGTVDSEEDEFGEESDDFNDDDPDFPSPNEEEDW